MGESKVSFSLFAPPPLPPHFFLTSIKMHIGKQLEANNANQIRQKLLARLRDHVMSDTQVRYHPNIGFTPDWETWTEELVVCHVAAREIVQGLSASQALDALVRKDEWISASLAAASALAPNCIKKKNRGGEGEEG